MSATAASRVELVIFKASDGDCILIRCFSDADVYHVLVDAGRSGTLPKLTSFLAKLPAAEQKIDLFIVTHIDADHIAGALAIAGDRVVRKLIREVWFNGPQHLVADGSIPLSIDQGDALIETIELNGWAWNAAFEGRAVVRRPEARPFIPAQSSQTSIHLLGPFKEALLELGKIWPISGLDEVAGEYRGAIDMGALDIEKLAAEKYVRDRAVPNGASIAFLLQHGSMTLLILADSHAEYLCRAIDEDFGGRIEVNIASLPHHGAAGNMSSELAGRVHADTWFVSTQGGSHRVKKPNGASIARVLCAAQRRGICFVFNSSHDETTMWDDENAQADFAYRVDYPDAEADWIAIRLTD